MVSKFAGQLRELGFKSITEIDSPDFKTVARKHKAAKQEGFSRQQLRRIERMRVDPHFMYFEGWTFATDETKSEWVAQGRINLNSIGFKNTVVEFFTMLRETNPTLH